MNVSWQKYEAPELPETFWAYLAGLLDGDGCFGIYNMGPRIGISNTHRETLDWVLKTLGIGRISEMKSNTQFRRTTQCFQWDCGAVGVRTILPRIAPYLKVKKEAPSILEEYVNGINPDNISKVPLEESTRRKLLRERLHELNRPTSRGNQEAR